jgi:hypothetical protein
MVPEESFRFDLPLEVDFEPVVGLSRSTLPSTSSSGRDDWVVHLGSFEGWVGYGRAVK